MVRAVGIAALVTLLAACSDDPAPLEPAPLAEVCGAPGPFQLLSLAPDERVGSLSRDFAVIGDRLLFVAGKGQRYLRPGYGPLPATSTVYAVGPCGEDPVVVAEDIESIYEHPLWPGVALGCTMDGDDLVRLDPSGIIEPVLLANDACSLTVTVTKHGLLSYVSTDNHLYSAEFFPLLDPMGPVFGPPIRVAAPVPVLNALTGAVRLLPDEVLLLEADGDLVSFALPDLTRTVLQPGVVTFESSDDARYLLYQTGAPSGDDPYNPIGTIQIRDRSSGISVPVGTGSLGGSAYPYFFGPDVARVTLSSPTGHDRVILLPDFQFLDTPEGHELQARLPDGRWLATSGYGGGPWHVLDLEAGLTTLVDSHRGQLLTYTGAHIDLLINSTYNVQISRRLVRSFLDGSEPQTLADRANTNATVREDGRILTMADVDGRWLGDLTLVDPSTREASRIDTDVIPGLNLDWWVHPTEPDTLVYGVVDGERTGVWLARPTPLE